MDLLDFFGSHLFEPEKTERKMKKFNLYVLRTNGGIVWPLLYAVMLAYASIRGISDRAFTLFTVAGTVLLLVSVSLVALASLYYRRLTEKIEYDRGIVDGAYRALVTEFEKSKDQDVAGLWESYKGLGRILGISSMSLPHIEFEKRKANAS